MAGDKDERERSRQRAEEKFKAVERRDSSVKSEVEKERAATAAKTKKLRALRLANEAKERAAAKSVGTALTGLPLRPSGQPSRTTQKRKK